MKFSATACKVSPTWLLAALDLDLDISLSPWALQFPVYQSDEISRLLHAVSQLYLEKEDMMLLIDPTSLSPFSSILSLFSPVLNLLLDAISQVALSFGLTAPI